MPLIFYAMFSCVIPADESISGPVTKPHFSRDDGDEERIDYRVVFFIAFIYLSRRIIHSRAGLCNARSVAVRSKFSSQTIIRALV